MSRWLSVLAVLELAGCADESVHEHAVDPAFGPLACDAPFDRDCAIDTPVEIVALQPEPTTPSAMLLLGLGGHVQTIDGSTSGLVYGPPVNLGGSNRVNHRLLVCDDDTGGIEFIRSLLDRLVEPTIASIEGDMVVDATDFDKFEMAGARCMRGPAPSVLVGLIETDLVWVGSVHGPGQPVELGPPEQPHLEFTRFDARATDPSAEQAVLARVALGGTQIDATRVRLAGADAPAVLEAAGLTAPAGVFAISALDADADAMRFAVKLKEQGAGWSLGLLTIPAGGTAIWDTMELASEPQSLWAGDIDADGTDEVVLAGGADGVLVLDVMDDAWALVAAFEVEADKAIAVDLDGGPLEVVSIAPHVPGVTVQWDAL